MENNIANEANDIAVVEEIVSIKELIKTSDGLITIDKDAIRNKLEELAETADAFEVSENNLGEAKQLRSKIRQPRYDLDKIEAHNNSVIHQRMTDMKHKNKHDATELRSILLMQENRIHSSIKEIEDRKEAERVEKERIEKERIKNIDVMINDWNILLGDIALEIKAGNKSVTLLKEKIESFEYEYPKFEEYQYKAESIASKYFDMIPMLEEIEQKLIDEKKRKEEEETRLAEEKEKQEKIRLEQEARERELKEREERLAKQEAEAKKRKEEEEAKLQDKIDKVAHWNEVIDNNRNLLPEEISRRTIADPPSTQELKILNILVDYNTLVVEANELIPGSGFIFRKFGTVPIDKEFEDIERAILQAKQSSEATSTTTEDTPVENPVNDNLQLHKNYFEDITGCIDSDRILNIYNELDEDDEDIKRAGRVFQDRLDHALIELKENLNID